jgi:hypothetical protein
MNPTGPKHISTVEQDEADFSWSDFFSKNNNSFRYLLSRWKILLLFSLIGILGGLGYSFIKEPTYSARISFVVEDTKASGGGGLMSALSGLGGLDISSMLGGSGMLAGDNIMAILKSRVLMKEALLTPYNNGNYSLADRYAEVYGWKNKWAKSSKVKRVVSFPVGKKKCQGRMIACFILF